MNCWSEPLGPQQLRCFKKRRPCQLVPQLHAFWPRRASKGLALLDLL